MRIKKKTLLLLTSVIALLIVAGVVLADTESTTVTFVIPTSVDHSISYGTVAATCSSANFFFVESDAIKDGTQTAINVSGNVNGDLCQNSSVSATVINNVGSVNVNVSANFTAALPAGVTVKAKQGSSPSLPCPGSEYATATTVPNGAAVLIAQNISAQVGNAKVCWWADFSNFNGGVATTGITKTLTTHAVQS